MNYVLWLLFIIALLVTVTYSFSLYSSCDSYGQIMVWTISRIRPSGRSAASPSLPSHNNSSHLLASNGGGQGNSGNTYVISRRPQRLFRCQPSQYTRCDISWQMGIVVAVSCGVVSVFSVERDERLKAFDISCEEYLVDTDDGWEGNGEGNGGDKDGHGHESDLEDHVVAWQQSGRSEEADNAGLGFGRANANTAPTSSSSSNRLKRKNDEKHHKRGLSSTRKRILSTDSAAHSRDVSSEDSISNSSPAVECDCNIAKGLARRLAVVDDGSIVMHVELLSTPPLPAIYGMSRAGLGKDTGNDKAAGKNDDGDLVFTEDSRYYTPTPSTPLEQSSNDDNTPPSSSTSSTSSSLCGASQHFLLSYALSGTRTGRVLLPSPVTFMEAPSRSMSVITVGLEDGTVNIHKSGNLELIYSFKPHLNCAPLTASCFPANSTSNASQFISSTSSSAFQSVVTGKDVTAIVCVKFGPTPETPAIICVSSASGAVFIRPLPDFVKWEKVRMPSALAQLVGAPMQAVRGGLMQAHNIASEAAVVIAENAKNFVAEKVKMVSCL